MGESLWKSKLGGGFKYFLFSSLFGENSHFDEYFSKGLVQPPTRYCKHLVGFFFSMFKLSATAGFLKQQHPRGFVEGDFFWRMLP